MDLVLRSERERKGSTELTLALDLLAFAVRDVAVVDFAFLPAASDLPRLLDNPGLLETVGFGGAAPFPVGEADLLCVSMMNSIQVLRLADLLCAAGISPLARGRTRGPLVVGGGHAWPSPRALAELADLVVAGEGERPLRALVAAWRAAGGDRALALAAAADLPGVMTGAGLGAAPVWDTPVDDPSFPPGSTILRDGVGAVMLARGCPFACAFCNNTVTSGAYRVTPWSRVKEHLELLAAGGARSVVLFAASASHYRSEGRGIAEVVSLAESLGLSVRCLSDRPELYDASYLPRYVQEKQKIIVAPESSPRIRRQLFRKQLGDPDLQRALEHIVRAGVPMLQVYAILAVPTVPPGLLPWLPEGFEGEHAGDLDYLAGFTVDAARRLLRAGVQPVEDKPLVRLDCMPFVAAPGTPLSPLTPRPYRHYEQSVYYLEERILAAGLAGVVRVDRAIPESRYLLQVYGEHAQEGFGEALTALAGRLHGRAPSVGEVRDALSPWSAFRDDR